LGRRSLFARVDVTDSAQVDAFVEKVVHDGTTTW
jgi:hypothetical protein